MTNVVIPGVGGDSYVELASTRLAPKAHGRIFKKKILHMGSFSHPTVAGKKITVDNAFAQKLVDNFNSGVCDIVQVPMVDDANRHVENPERNIGRVIDLSYDDSGVYAYIDAVKHADDLGKTLIGASAMMNLDYTNTETGEKSGATLLHVAVTNRPYITKLDGFEEISLSNAEDEDTVLVDTEETVSHIADTDINDTVLLGAVQPQEKDESMTKEELIAALKKDHNIDVDSLLTAPKAAEPQPDLTALSNVLGTESTVSIDEVADAVLELSKKNDEQHNLVLELSTKNEQQSAVINELVAERDTLRLSRAEGEIDALIGEGRILPKQRDVMVKLSMSDRDTFDALLPEEAIVSLSESGVTNHTDSRSDKTQEELNRYLAELGVKTENK